MGARTWLLVLVVSVLQASIYSVNASAQGDTIYSLDTMSRTIVPTGKMRCPKVAMRKYRGTHVRYHKPVYIYEGFESHLTRFEKIVSDVAIEVYGRAPSRIAHVGTYNCRRIRRYPDLLSEHGIGNAIDVAGFNFSRAKGTSQQSESPHKRLRRSFQVRVDKHWDKTRGIGKIHARFLKAVTDRLIAEEVFRVMLGPAYPGHQDHFHFDQAPYSLIQL